MAESLYKNWPVICEIENDLLRLLVSTTDDETVLAGLQKGFPHLFADQETIVRVPASALREQAAAYSRGQWNDDRLEECDRELGWNHITDEFGIPTAAYWNSDDMIPLSLRRQFVGQKVQGGMKVTYRGIECVTSAFDDSFMIGTTITEVPKLDYLVIVPAKFIDLEK